MSAFFIAMEKEKKLTDEQLIKRAQTQFTQSKNWQDEKVKDRWKRSNDAYDSIFPADQKAQSDVLQSQGRLFIPKTYSHTQRILTDILDTYFHDKEEILDITNWKTIPSETRSIVKSLLNYRLNGHPINFYQEAYEACLDTLKNKVGIMKVYPKIRNEKVSDGEGNFNNFFFYNPQIECIPYEDVFFSPQATWKDYWRYPQTHRMLKSLDYLKRRGYKNLVDIQTISDLTVGDEIKEQRAQDQGSPFISQEEFKVNSLSSILIYEHWDFLDIDGDGFLESCSYITAGDAGGPKILIRDVEINTLPYKIEGEDYNSSPIVVGQALPEAHKMYGKDLPEITDGLQRETNALRNQEREAVALSLRKPTLVQKESGLDLVALVNRQIGDVVMGDDISPSAVREMDISGPNMASANAQQRTDHDFMEVTSISPSRLGAEASKRMTATEDVNLQQNANKKIAGMIRNLEHTLFIPVFRKLLRLEQEYCSDDFVALVTGRTLGWQFAQDGFPAKLFIQGDFELTINTNMNKQQQLQRIFTAIDKANQANQSTFQLVQGGVVDPKSVYFISTMKLYERALPILGEKNIDEYKVGALRPPAEGDAPGVASQPRQSGQSAGPMGTEDSSAI